MSEFVPPPFFPKAFLKREGGLETGRGGLGLGNGYSSLFLNNLGLLLL